MKKHHIVNHIWRHIVSCDDGAFLIQSVELNNLYDRRYL